MKKKVIFFIVVPCFVLCLAAATAGFFYWQQNQADVKELNENLPEGVKVVKSLINNEYKVVNKIDNYEFKIPPEWQGLNEIEYFPQEIEQGYTGSSIGLEGEEGAGRIAAIARFQIGEPDIDLEFWVKTYFETSGLINDFNRDKVGEFEVIKTRDFIISMLGYVYFFKKNLTIYAIACGSEEFIRYIITNGKW